MRTHSSVIKRSVLGIFMLIGLLAVACTSGDDPTATPTSTADTTAPATATATTPAATATPTATRDRSAATATPTVEAMIVGAAAVNAIVHPDLGTAMLVDSDGLALYLFTPDSKGVSTCTGGCADFWPPLLTVGDATARGGVSADHLGSIEREDGGTQVTYNGWPLYYFSGDSGPGVANGQDSQDVWYVVSTFGGPIQTAALVETSVHATLGTILTDRSGRVQYLYTPDDKNVSACSGACAMAWPPLLTVGDPTPGDGVSADHLGTIEREDGGTQVTYNGRPLYYFAFDNTAGDTNGQASSDVWFTVSTSGEAVAG